MAAVTETPKRRSHDSDRLYRRRLAAGLTMPELAERAGVGLGTVSRAESGLNVRVPTLRAIAAALNCEISDLMPAETEPAAP